MNRLSIGIGLLVGALVVPSTGEAAPPWGSNCLSCHDVLTSDALFTFDFDTIADPDETVTGATDRGTLNVFRVVRGTSVTLSAQITGLADGDTYAVALKRFGFAGVENGGHLTYTGDCSWVQWRDPGDHFTDPAYRHAWETGPSTFTFEIGVDASTPNDYYDLVFALAGKLAETSDLYYAEEHFYLRVTDYITPGDLDEDGDVDLFDYGMFGPCVAGPAGNDPQPDCDQQAFDASDLDDDGDVDLLDFSRFTLNFTG